MSVERIALGIDPGRSGAATALDIARCSKGKGRVLDCLQWDESIRRGVRGYAVLGEWFKTVGGLMDYLLNEWVHEIADEGDRIEIAAISVEGMVIPDLKGKSRKSGKSIITLIEETGAAVDAVRGEVDNSIRIYRPTAAVWRGRILKIGAYTKRAEAEAYAVAMVPRLFESGHGLHSTHEVESACIAMYTREAILTGDL